MSIPLVAKTAAISFTESTMGLLITLNLYLK